MQIRSYSIRPSAARQPRQATANRTDTAATRNHNHHQTSELPLARRDALVLGATALVTSLSLSASLPPPFGGMARADPSPSAPASNPPPPPVGDCTDCVGEVNGTLNACPLDAESCVSTLNDDEGHFAAPWSFDETSKEAADRLVNVATGGVYEPGLISTPNGISRIDAGLYVVKGVLRVVTNQPGMPEQPKRRVKKDVVPFDGSVTERRALEGGGEYVRIVFGASPASMVGGGEGTSSSTQDVIDAEFLFLPNDNIVNVRAASRGDGSGSGELALSFTKGLTVDRNVARRKLDALRTALHWELTPILTDFDPQFNPEAPTWVEKVFKPFDERSRFQPSGASYPLSE